MDPVTHTLVGASLAGAGLRRTTPLATLSLVVAANAPDVDILAQVKGSYAALAFRRGLTHGLPAMLVLPFVVAGAILAGDRWIRRRRRPHSAPTSPGAILALSFLGVWTHPALDWLNNYGMRWLMPLDDRWSYGDALFIIDPWIWMLLGGSAFLVWSGSATSRWLWGLLAGAMSLLVLGTGMVPLAGQALWLAGLAVWIGLRLRLDDEARAVVGPRLARWTLAASAVYIALMVFQNLLAERSVAAEATAMGLDRLEDVMVAPVPARPLQGQVVLVTPEAYHRGRFSWTSEPRLTLDDPPLARLAPDPVSEVAWNHPEARDFLVWSRYPWHAVHPDDDGWLVEIRDARYLDRRASGGLLGLTVRVGPDMEAR